MIKNKLWLVLVAAVTAAVLLRNDASPAVGQMPKKSIIQEMFEELSENPDVTRMWREIVDGKVGVRLGERGDMVASFSRDDGEEFLTLNESYVRLAMQSTGARERMKSYLVHEAVHHAQYHADPDAPEKASCSDWWLAERDAYEAQCAYAASVGIGETLRNTCSVGHPDVFRHNLLVNLLYRGIDPHGAECREGFFELERLL